MEEIRENKTQREKPVEDETAEEAELVEEPPAEEFEMTTEQEMTKMQQELEGAKSETEAATDAMLRLAAELDNYKKRTVKERESLIKYATQDIIQELLPILDNFERAIESASKTKDFNSFLEGVKMIFKQMYDALEKKGVNKIDAVGKAFDPNIHEAVMQLTSEEYPENVIVEELQPGYTLHDRVIRPSMVVVSRGSKEEE